MLGLEFDFSVADLRKKLIHTHKIFTGRCQKPEFNPDSSTINHSKRTYRFVFWSLKTGVGDDEWDLTVK